MTGAPPRRVAAFDFDGTITRRDSMLPFLAALRGRRRVAAALGREAARAARDGAPPDRRDRAKRRVLAELLAGLEAAEFDEAGRRFAATLPPGFRAASVEQLAWHRRQDHEIVLVSASLAVYLQHLAPVVGASHVMAVEMEVDGGGVLTGELAGPNVRGPEKARRLREWLGDTPAEIWAYGDSSGDRELLALADHPTWVGPGPGRARYLGWKRMPPSSRTTSPLR